VSYDTQNSKLYVNYKLSNDEQYSFCVNGSDNVGRLTNVSINEQDNKIVFSVSGQDDL
jgi:hypothetical protein